MQQNISIRLLPHEAADPIKITGYLAQTTGLDLADISGFHLLKQSIDARGKITWVNLTLKVFINEPFTQRAKLPFEFKDVSHSNNRVIIIGAGPAGLFAALKCLELGIKPIVLERGRDVRSRRRDLAALNKLGEVNPESNYCFGEGGAGTYSDGKLYTRSTKRGNVTRVLALFVHFGADERILYEAHPHIGTNKLPHIISAMREQILASGGEVHFEQKVIDFEIDQNGCKGVKTAQGHSFTGQAVVLATGHSARDIFELLHQKGIQIESKPFALGVRVEHPQSVIDAAQYHCSVRDPFLPPAAYSLVQQVNERGVFSFCMCPGGIIAPAATAPGELVVNGWSPSKRNNPFANSGMVVQVNQTDAFNYFQAQKKNGPLNFNLKMDDPLLLMRFQQRVEQKAFEAGGGKFMAPAQRMADFVSNKVSGQLGDCSYLPGVRSTSLKEVLPSFIHYSLQEGFKAFGKKMRGYFTNEAMIVATESRTSSPVRIPRNEESLQHPQIKNLYPCAEGGGYAGGIVSAAMDGERVIEQIAREVRE